MINALQWYTREPCLKCLHLLSSKFPWVCMHVLCHSCWLNRRLVSLAMLAITILNLMPYVTLWLIYYIFFSQEVSADRFLIWRPSSVQVGLWQNLKEQIFCNEQQRKNGLIMGNVWYLLIPNTLETAVMHRLAPCFCDVYRTKSYMAYGGVLTNVLFT